MISRIQINFECAYQETVHEGTAHALYGLIKFLDIIKLSCPWGPFPVLVLCHDSYQRIKQAVDEAMRKFTKIMY